MLTLTNYQSTEELYESGNSIIYRAKRTSDNQPVILKILKDEYPSATKIAWFKREYEVIQDLDIAGVIDAYALETREHRWVIVLEDFGGQSLSQLALAGQLDVAKFLILAIQITDILDQIHQKNIIHKDINPSNIILNITTGVVKFIDFGISTVLSRETPAFRNPNVLEGTLAYISPEQTGRMNRAIDYRTDFYSLGVTFYQLLTGQLPFTSTDPLEVIHNHLAKQPRPPRELQPTVPLVLSQIIMKLMAKNAEDRYQSAHGLQADLTKCLQQWQSRGEIEAFPLGQADNSDRFQIPQKLYGRAEEIDTLLTAFEQVSQGMTKLMLVAGYAGIGKSALVQEIYKPITERRGYFVRGKFDQYQQNLPFSAIIQALSDFVNQLLTESTAELEAWRAKIMAAVGNSGQVIIDVVPSLSHIIGEQPPIPEVGPVETQNRFNFVFESFMQAIAQPEHPLVLFIDDWQWADSASLNFLKRLMSEAERQHLMVLGAYRDNEVDATHPFRLTLDDLEKTEAQISQINLKPLQKSDVEIMTGETLNQAGAEVLSLAELIYQKTQGNPFFVTQFLQSLYDNDQVRFDYEARRWQWDLTEIQALDITDNVVELLAEKIENLHPDTQQVLKYSSCIGSQFDLQTLALINDKGLKATQDDLWQAVTEGLIEPFSGSYQTVMDDTVKTDVAFKFVHDRVQQATYSLLDDDARRATNLQLGNLLLENNSEENVAEMIFDIVNYLNIGQALITDEAARLALGRLNLQAGKKAKQATAYQPALEYFNQAADVVGDEPWANHYDLTYDLYKEQGETEFLVGNYKNSNKLLDEALAQAHSTFDKAQIYTIKVAQLAGQGQYIDAISATIDGLNMLGLDVPTLEETERQEQATGAELALYQENMGKRGVADLYNLPVMQDEAMNFCTQLIAIAVDSLGIAMPALHPYYTAKVVNTSIEYGLSEYTSINYVSFSLIPNILFKDYDSTYEFARLAIRLIENKLPNRKIEAKVYLFSSAFIILREHLSAGIAYQRKGIQSGLEGGDVLYVAYILTYLPRFVITLDLNEGLVATEKSISFLQKINNVPLLLLTEMYRGFGQSLKGQTAGQTSFDNDTFTEAAFIEAFKEAAPLFYGHYARYKLQVLTLFADYQAALPLVHERATWVSVTGASDLVLICDYYLYSGLTITHLYPEADEDDRQTYLDILDEALVELKRLADQSTANFGHAHLILLAEKAQLDNDLWEAGTRYDRAIQLAQDHDFKLNEALANELAGEMYIKHGKQDIATLYLTRAAYLYNLWGASAKAAEVNERYGQLLRARATSERTSLTSLQTATTINRTVTGTTTSQVLDVNSVLKASQAISGEIELSRLLTNLMKIVIENGGAEKGFLILNEAGRWVIEAEGAIGQDEVTTLQSIPVAEGHLSTAIVNYVARTRQNIVLDDAANDGDFTQDAYIVTHQPKSILCAPLINQGKLNGILYLENNLSTGAFTPDRLEVLNLLSSQAAISIENAGLYTDLEASEKKYRAVFEDSKDVIFITTAEGQIVDISPACLEVFGYTREEMLQANMADFYVNPADRQAFRQQIEQQSEVRDLELKYHKKDGTPLDCVETATVRYAEDGTVLGYQGIIRDITEQKENERLRAETLRLETELDVARNLQQMLLPPEEELQRIEGLDIAGFMEPADEVGGDYYDVLQHNGQVKIGIGDVTDHGLESGVVMLMTQMGVRTLLLSGESDPVRFMDVLNRAIYENGLRLNHQRSLTLALLDYMPPTTETNNGLGRLKLSGQHEEVIIVRKDGTLELVDTAALGFPIGIDDDIADFVDEVSITLAPGDGLVLYTDGITEAENINKEFYGLGQLCQIIQQNWDKSAPAIREAVVEDVRRYIGEQKVFDDITLVVLKQK